MTPPNALYFGDNLEVLRSHIPDASVDLVYLDPPFNSNRNYNVLFRNSDTGKHAQAQITAFEDTWHWNESASQLYHDLVNRTYASSSGVSAMIGALRTLLKESEMMAYLVHMTARLVELHRVLKPTGSLYLHCDPTASHYLKIVLDSIFGAENFRNEIIWKRQNAHSDARRKFPNITDTILFYGKTANAYFKPVHVAHDTGYTDTFYRHDDNDGRGKYRLDNITSPNPRPNLMYEWQGFKFPTKGWRFSQDTMQRMHDEGRIHYPKNADGSFDFKKRPAVKRYLGDMKGNVSPNLWDDIAPLQSQDAERLGYPTQKPLALLKRIIEASSKPGDVILDPFCGCGTAVIEAQALGRRWIGIDVTHIAINLIRARIKDMFPAAVKDYALYGLPQDLESARQLAVESEHDGRYQFQFWALGEIGAKPLTDGKSIPKGKKGADRGIDGEIPFVDAGGKRYSILVQVKSGHVKSGDIRDLRGTIEREGAVMGIFLTLEQPTRDMLTEASAAGLWTDSFGTTYPRLQVVSVQDLFAGRQPRVPSTLYIDTLKRARPVTVAGGSEQLDLL